MGSYDDPIEFGNRAHFATTQWSIVLSAAGESSSESNVALETLCRAYWYPLYAFVRRRGYSSVDACDLTQEFFRHLLEKRSLVNVDRARGRFRSFLLASLQHFLANEWDRAHARKRGGDVTLLSFDAVAAEDSYRLEPAHNLTAERIFERRWALTLLERVLQRLQDEHVQANKGSLFEALRPTLVDSGSAGAYQDLAVEVGMSEGAVKVAVHRLRKRYRSLLLDEIAQTVASHEEVNEELHTLMAAVRD
jgi:RNA polymerase sigma factor (sigma-70 family)